MEDRRVKKKLEEEAYGIADSEIIEGEAEVHFSDEVIYLQSTWEPTNSSYEEAKQGIFKTTEVYFKHAGPFNIPWTKSKFKREHSTFVDSIIEKLEKEKAEKDAEEIKPVKGQKVFLLLNTEGQQILNQLKQNQEEDGTDANRTEDPE
jgi:hypothetical protein